MQLFNGLPGLLAVRNFIKGQILNQCQNNIPRLKPDLPPQVSAFVPVLCNSCDCVLYCIAMRRVFNLANPLLMVCSLCFCFPLVALLRTVLTRSAIVALCCCRHGASPRLAWAGGGVVAAGAVAASAAAKAQMRTNQSLSQRATQSQVGGQQFAHTWLRINRSPVRSSPVEVVSSTCYSLHAQCAHRTSLCAAKPVMIRCRVWFVPCAARTRDYRPGSCVYATPACASSSTRVGVGVGVLQLMCGLLCAHLVFVLCCAGEEYTASGRPKRKRKNRTRKDKDYVFEGDDEFVDGDGEAAAHPVHSQSSSVQVYGSVNSHHASLGPACAPLVLLLCMQPLRWILCMFCSQQVPG
jgi:hypothetical protein